MTRRQCTKQEERMRAELEQKLNSLQPISAEVRELMTFEGFTRWYRRMQHLYPTKVEAYEALEFHYERLTGHRRYSEYDSFRSVSMRKCNNVSL